MRSNGLRLGSNRDSAQVIDQGFAGIDMSARLGAIYQKMLVVCTYFGTLTP